MQPIPTPSEHQSDQAMLLTTLSHEFRTPLTSISAISDLLGRNSEGHLSDEELRQIDLVKKNARRLKTLIDDLFDISRIESGTLSLEKGEFDVRQLLWEVADSFEPVFEQGNQWLVVSVPDEEVWIDGDRDRIAQVVCSLVTNASKYSRPECEVQLSLSVEDDELVIEVTDEGVGISADDLERVFAPFYRADNTKTRRVPGTGLGLAVAKSVAELHGGSIVALNRGEKGSIFEVRLPGRVSRPLAEFPEEVSRAS